MKRTTDIYHRWVAWSEEVQCYIVRCPDLFHETRALRKHRAWGQASRVHIKDNSRPSAALLGALGALGLLLRRRN